MKKQVLSVKGYIEAELDIKPELPFFGCHFIGDPVMPGYCLGLDAMAACWVLFRLDWWWQRKRARALGVGEVKFLHRTTFTNS